MSEYTRRDVLRQSAALAGGLGPLLATELALRAQQVAHRLERT